MRPRTPRIGLLLAAGSLVLTTGCSGDPEAVPRTDQTTASTPTSPAGPATDPASDPATEPSSAPASSAAAEVTPAVGMRYQRQVVSFVLPKEFEVLGDTGNGLLRSADFAAKPFNCFFSVAELGGADLLGTDLDAAAQQSIDAAADPMTRQDDREVGGETVYVLSGSSASAPVVYEFGRVSANKAVALTFRFFDDKPANQQLVDSILATVEWKG